MEDNADTSGIEKLLFIENYKIFSGNSNLKTECRDRLTAILNDAMSGYPSRQKNINNRAEEEYFSSVDISLYRFSGAGMKKLFCSHDAQNIKNESLNNFGRYIFICFIKIK